MPRTQVLSNLTPNHIYALDAQVRYIHHTGKSTSAVIEQENTQSLISIPASLENIKDEIQEGISYHFGYCYVTKNGWIRARNPDATIRPIEGNLSNQNNVRELPEIAQKYEELNGQYLSTLLYVVKINQAQKIVKNGKQLTLCIIKCFSNGLLVDLVLWNSDLPIAETVGKWIVFSAFKLKKIADWKFALVASVFSEMIPFENQNARRPYSPFTNYEDLSQIHQVRTALQLEQQIKNYPKLYTRTEALVTKVQPFTYKACAVCKKKVKPGFKCLCNPELVDTDCTILKVFLAIDEQNVLKTAVFDLNVQAFFASLDAPKVVKMTITSTKKTLDNGHEIPCHIISSASL